MKRVVLLASLVASLLGAGAARADDARPHRDAARDAYRAGDVARACAALRRAVEAEPSPASRADLADCEERSGHAVVARELFVSASKDAKGALAIAVRRRIDALEARLAEVRFEPGPGVPDDAVVVSEGRTLGLSSSMWLVPGEWSATIRAAGSRPRTVSGRLAAGERRVIALGPMDPVAPVVRPSPPPTPTPAPAARPALTPTLAEAGGSPFARGTGYVSLGLGLAALAVGATSGIVAMQNARIVSRECDDVYRCSARGVEAGRDGETFGEISTATLIGGGAAVLVGGVLLFLGRRREIPVFVTSRGAGVGGTF
ncbi:MAG: hypothetical protein JST00_19050 [Deltaproteobacteria bacterium]|nr:hypothetical protein [Deltaproteobacteria bacterium]